MVSALVFAINPINLHVHTGPLGVLVLAAMVIMVLSKI
jgi:hypothetical protein